MTILIATTSLHKAQEIADLLAAVPNLQLQNLSEYPATEAPEEDGHTMAANARLKAEFYANHYGVTVLADDSGLEVDALDGEPGIHSARWAPGSDADRAAALLQRLEGVPEERRGARYRCALCLAAPEAVVWEGESTCEGAITTHTRGGNGFGYDPVFEITLGSGAPAEWVGHTIAEAPPAVKASISHRAGAVRQLASYLKSSG